MQANLGCPLELVPVETLARDGVQPDGNGEVLKIVQQLSELLEFVKVDSFFLFI